MWVLAFSPFPQSSSIDYWRFHNSKFYQDGVISRTPNSQFGGLGTALCLAPTPLTCLVWVALPGAYAPTGIALLVIGVHRPPLHDKVVFLEEGVIAWYKKRTGGCRCVCVCVLIKVVVQSKVSSATQSLGFWVCILLHEYMSAFFSVFVLSCEGRVRSLMKS
jgi:hypothetical protein